MDQFDATIARIATSLREIRKAALLICVCDDPHLEDYALQRLRTEILPFAVYDEFTYSPRFVSLLQSERFSRDQDKRQVISVLGLESLSRDDQSEAIRLLNLERNRLGFSGVAVILWITRQLLKRISAEAADFFSWRSATFFIPEPRGWDRREAYLRQYYSTIQRRLVDETHSLLFSAEASNPVKWLSVGRTFRNLGRENAFNQVNSHDTVELKEVFEQKRVCILGAPGSGKTTLMEGIALCLAGETDTALNGAFQSLHGKIPVLIAAGMVTPSSIVLEREVRSALEADTTDGMSDFVDSLLDRGEIVLLIDGADEVADIAQFSAGIRSFAEQYQDCSVVVTARISNDLKLSEEDGWKWYLLEGLTESEVRRSLALLLDEGTTEVLLSQFRQNPALAVFARSPELLQMAAAVVAQEGRLPGSRFALLSVATNLLLTRDRSRSLIGREGIPVPREVQQFLPQLAWIFQDNKVQSISRRELTTLLLLDTQEHAPFSSEEVEAFIRNAMHYTSIFQVTELDRNGEPLFGFSHRLLQEYFAAVRLVRRWQIDGADALPEAEKRIKWVSVISLASAGMTSPYAEKLVSYFMNEWIEKKEASGLLLAGSCMADGAPLSERLRTVVVLELLNGYLEEPESQSKKADAWRAKLKEVMVGVGISNRQFISSILEPKGSFDKETARRVMQLFLTYDDSVGADFFTKERL